MGLRFILPAASAAAALSFIFVAVVTTADRPGPPEPHQAVELFVPESWGGEWEIHIEYRNLATGNVIATEDVTDTICPNDRLGLSAYVAQPGDGHGSGQGPGRGLDGAQDGVDPACHGSLQDEHLQLACQAHFTHNTCRVDFTIDVRVDRHLDAMNGSADWRVVATSGDCAAVLEEASLGESIQLWGLRLNRDLTGCSAPPASLVEKLLSQPELMRLLPPPIEDLAARADGRTAGLVWTAVPDAAAYEIYRAPADGPFERVARIRGAGRRPRYPFRDAPLANGLTYRYVVRWIDGDGRHSPVSNEVAVTPAVERP